jgi:hypothetical protein
VTSFSDDFNRADGSPGANWVQVSGTWVIVSNQLSPGTTGGTVLLRAATAMASNDNYAQVTITATTPVSQGVWCRGDPDLTSGYALRNNGSNWALFSVVGGTFTSIGTYSAAAVAGDVAKVQAVGSTITAYINGISRINVTNTAVTTGTSVGIRSEANTGLRFDNFSAADVTAGATLGTASSTETAQPLTGAKAGALAIAGATESAQPLTGGKTTLLTPAATTETGQPVTGTKAATLGLAAASEAAQQLAGSKTAALGTATEAGSAQAVTGAKTGTLAPAVEQETAQVLSGVKTATLGIAGSVEAAQPLTLTFPATLPAAETVETALPLVGTKTATLTPALEVGTAHPLTVASTNVPSPERTYMIPADNRRLTVAAEHRYLTVAADNRTLEVRR